MTPQLSKSPGKLSRRTWPCLEERMQRPHLKMFQSSKLWNKLITIKGGMLNGSLGQSPQQRQEDDCNAEKGQVCQCGYWHESE